MDMKKIITTSKKDSWITQEDVEMVSKIRRKFNNIGLDSYESINKVQIYNKICSCIDWLQSFVFVSSFKCLGGNNSNGNNYETTFYLSSQINSLNVIVDGVMEFLRAIDEYKETSLRRNFLHIKENFSKSISFNIEAIRELGMNIINDFNFFKEIRAVFAAHQNNLGVDGNKYFAGWSLINQVENDVIYISYLYRDKKAYRFQILKDEIYSYVQFCLSQLHVILENL